MDTTVLAGTVMVVVGQAIKLSAISKLRRAGSQVLVAHDTPEAQELCRSHRVDLVVSRLTAQGPAGCKMCREITAYANQGGAGVVLAADGASSRDFNRCLRACAIRVFTRSIADELVLSHLTLAMEERGASHAKREGPAAGPVACSVGDTKAEPPAKAEPEGSRWAFKASLLDIPSHDVSPLERVASQASDAWFWVKLRAKSLLAEKLGPG